jgi:cytoskeletal protein RodZ
MELNAKIASLEDEVKLLKGEVKLILSEIRTAILGQDNPFAEPGQALRADPGALESRPPIKVVRIASEDDEAETPEQPSHKSAEAIWDDEPEARAPEPAMAVEEPPEAPPPEEPVPAPVRPVATRQAPVQPPEPVPVARVEPAPAPWKGLAHSCSASRRRSRTARRSYSTRVTAAATRGRYIILPTARST